MRYSKKRIYLAGPDVFLPNAIEIGEQKKEICRAHGFEGASSFDNEIQAEGLSPSETGLAIYNANVELIRSSAYMIANMTPFRGPSIDPGTAYEMGLMQVLKRPVLGYRNTTEAYIQRVFRFFGEKAHRAKWPEENGRIIDPKGMAIENFGFGDSLMADCSVIRSGFAVIENRVPYNECFTNLEAFEMCVKALRKFVNS